MATHLPSTVADLYHKHIVDNNTTPTHLFVGPDAHEHMEREARVLTTWGMVRHDPKYKGPATYQNLIIVKIQDPGIAVGTFTTP